MSAFELEVQWDPAKARRNLAKHQVSLALAATVLHDPLSITVFDAAHSLVEDRWFTLGRAQDGRLLAVAHTFEATGPASARARIISAREATRAERRQYEDGFA